MPRRPRSDAPGAVHHVYHRGIERRDLFLDDHDRRVYLGWLETAIPEAGGVCYAWALQRNHVHLVLRTGHEPTAKVMHRIGTGYAIHFNRRYGREGYVFERRYGARPVESDPDLVGLIRYVHRNPIVAGDVLDVAALERHPWAGHGPLVGQRPAPSFQTIGAVLSLFGEARSDARESLRVWMEAPIPEAAAPLDEGALDRLIAAVCADLGASETGLRRGQRTRPESNARDMIARRAAAELGIRASTVAHALGVSRQALWDRLRPRPTEKLDSNARPLS